MIDNSRGRGRDPDVPDRTLRYRTERLTRLGLVGRSRPYRDKGSAPFHYWPTRASDAFVRVILFLPAGSERRRTRSSSTTPSASQSCTRS